MNRKLCTDGQVQESCRRTLFHSPLHLGLPTACHCRDTFLRKREIKICKEIPFCIIVIHVKLKCTLKWRCQLTFCNSMFHQIFTSWRHVGWFPIWQYVVQERPLLVEFYFNWTLRRNRMRDIFASRHSAFLIPISVLQNPHCPAWLAFNRILFFWISLFCLSNL